MRENESTLDLPLENAKANTVRLGRIIRVICVIRGSSALREIPVRDETSCARLRTRLG